MVQFSFPLSSIVLDQAKAGAHLQGWRSAFYGAIHRLTTDSGLNSFFGHKKTDNSTKK